MELIKIRGRGTAENPPNRFERLTFEPDPAAADPDDPSPGRETHYFRDHTRTIIAHNDSPDVGFEYSINPYRGCEHGCCYCLSGDTAILMADGTTRLLADLRVDDAIYGTVQQGNQRRYLTTRVLAHWSTRKPAYRITLVDGTELIASADHRFLTERGWEQVAGAEHGRACCPSLTTSAQLMGIVAHDRPPREAEPSLRRKGSLHGEAVKSDATLRVAAIEALGVTRTLFDITTGTGDFIANGVISHNCYARPTHEWLGFSAGLDFETKILVKEDAPELLRAELASPRWTPVTLAMSGVTDPYQPIERRLRLTRRCLEVLAEFRNPVAIVTKNHLVTRDLDLLAELAGHGAAAVFLSVTTLDQELQRVMEPRTSTPARRLDALRQLAAAGVPVGVMVAPVIPGLTDHELPSILQAAAAAGARTAGLVPLRLPLGVKDLFPHWLETHFPERREKVLGRVRAMRGGKLNDSRFRSRMRGEGVYADQIRALFQVASRKAGIDQKWTGLSTAAFRRPDPTGQLGLFDAPEEE